MTAIESTLIPIVEVKDCLFPTHDVFQENIQRICLFMERTLCNSVNKKITIEKWEST